MRKGTKWRCLAILLSAAVLIGLAASCSQAKTAFQVNGHKVERAEWIHYMERRRDKVAAILEERHGIELLEDEDWLAPVDGQTPLEHLGEYAAEEIARIKLEQLYAREYGIKTPLSYTEQQKDYEEAREKRAREQAEGEAQYGADDLDFDTWWTDLYLGMKAKLMDVLVERDVFSITEAMLQDLYETMKAQLRDPYNSYESSRVYLYNQLAEQMYEEEIDRRLENADITRLNMEIDLDEL